MKYIGFKNWYRQYSITGTLADRLRIYDRYLHWTNENDYRHDVAVIYY